MADTVADLTITLPADVLPTLVGVLNTRLTIEESAESRDRNHHYYQHWLARLRTAHAVLTDAADNPDRHTLPPGTMALIMTPDTIREVADLPEHVTDAHIQQAISDAANTSRFAGVRDALGDAWDSAVYDIANWAEEIADDPTRQPASHHQEGDNEPT